MLSPGQNRKFIRFLPVPFLQAFLLNLSLPLQKIFSPAPKLGYPDLAKQWVLPLTELLSFLTDGVRSNYLEGSDLPATSSFLISPEGECDCLSLDFSARKLYPPRLLPPSKDEPRPFSSNLPLGPPTTLDSRNAASLPFSLPLSVFFSSKHIGKICLRVLTLLFLPERYVPFFPV